MSDQPDIVMTTRYVGAREVRAVSIHAQKREPDGSSAIDPARSHLNEILHGPNTQIQAVDQMKRAGVKPPTKQSEAPFVQMVLSASPEAFRDDPEQAGTWNDELLRAWRDCTMRWLRAEYGLDLAHVSLHLDEDTPHVHVLVVPTYEKTPRKPGRQRKNETEQQFEERKNAAENGETVRTMSRSSSPYWKRAWCRRDARVSYHQAMRSLGLSYGTDHVGTGDASLDRKETGAWVREQAAQVKADRAEIETERDDLRRIRSELDEKSLELGDKEAELVAEKTRLRKLSQEMSAAYESAKQVLADVREARHLPRDVRKSLRDGIRDLRDALQPPKARTERDRINDQIVSQQSPAPDQRPGPGMSEPE